MSNFSSGKKYTDSVAEANKSLKDDLTKATNRATKAEEQNAVMMVHAADMESQNAKLTNRLSAFNAETSELGEAGRRLELFAKQLEVERGVMHDQIKELREKLETTQRTNLVQIEERTRLELQLAVALKEKEGIEAFSKQERERLLDDKQKLTASVTTGEERLRTANSEADAVSRERDTLQRALAVAEAEARLHQEQLAKSEQCAEVLQAEKDTLAQKLKVLEVEASNSREEMLRARDAAVVEASSLSQQLSVAVAERAQIEERRTKSEQQASALLAELSVWQSRAAGSEERHANEVALRTAKGDECTRLGEQLALAQAEGRGKDFLVGKLEQQAVELRDEIKVLLARADAATERTTALQEACDAVNTSRAAAAEQLAATTADRLRQERDAVEKDMEKRLAEHKRELAVRAEQAELRCKELIDLRDESQASVATLYEQLVASQEARTQLQADLAVLETEKRIADERGRLAEARAAENMNLREAALEERNRATEATKVSQGEKQALESLNSRLEGRATALESVQSRLKAAANSALEKADDMLRQRDALAVSKQLAESTVLEAHDQKSQVQSQLVEANAQMSVFSEHATRLEKQIDKLQEDKLQLAERVNAADQERVDMLRQRDVAVAESARTLEQMAEIRGRQSKMEERTAYLNATIETLHADKAGAQAATAEKEATLLSTQETLRLRLAAAEELARNEANGHEAKADECSRLKEEAAAAVADRRGKDVLIQTLEQQVTGYEERKLAAQQLTLERSERMKLDEMVQKAERRLHEYKIQLDARAEFAEQRVNQLSELRGESETSAATLKAQLAASEAARAQIQQMLAVKTTEKRNADEQARLAEMKLAENVSDRDAALNERNFANEAAQGAIAEKRAIEAVCAQLERQLAEQRADHARMNEFLKESSQIQVAMARNRPPAEPTPYQGMVGPSGPRPLRVRLSSG